MPNLLMISLPYAKHLLMLYKNVDNINSITNCILFLIMCICICFFGVPYLMKITHTSRKIWITLFIICFGCYTVTIFNRNNTKYSDEQSIETVIHYHQLKHLTNKYPYINVNSDSQHAKTYRALEHKYYNESNHQYVTKNTHHIHYIIKDSAVKSKPRWWQYL